MVGNLDGQMASAVARRAVRLRNGVPMVTLKHGTGGFEMPVADGVTGRSPRRRCPKATRISPLRGLPDLAAWIASGAITSRRLTEIYLDRIERLNPHLFCFATVTPGWHLAEADAMDALTNGKSLGPLHGILWGEGPVRYQGDRHGLGRRALSGPRARR
ncbi:MAG: hypothetical protein R3D85_12395 [Paracoccaceae bacterium]